MVLIAAPAGARARGAVEPAKAAPDKPVPTKAREAPKTTTTKRQPPPKTQKTTANVPKPAKPPPKTTAAPKAGGGPVGGKGSDVTNLRMEEGVDFPYPGYLQNLTNAVMERFDWDGKQPYTADVKFLIKRDGSVASIQLLKSTGNYAFRAEAQGSIQAAGNAKAFGPLPDGFSDDVLSIVFTFDPKVISGSRR
jgi:outer membrane biosynthesis protein TonB